MEKLKQTNAVDFFLCTVHAEKQRLVPDMKRKYLGFTLKEIFIFINNEYCIMVMGSSHNLDISGKGPWK